MSDDKTMHFLDRLDELLRPIPIYTTPLTPREADWSPVFASEPAHAAWLQLDAEHCDATATILSEVSGICAKVSVMAMEARKLCALAATACGDNERAATLFGISLDSFSASDSKPWLQLVPDDPGTVLAAPIETAPDPQLELTAELTGASQLFSTAVALLATAPPMTSTFELAGHLLSAAAHASDGAQLLRDTAVRIDDRVAKIAAEIDAEAPPTSGELEELRDILGTTSGDQVEPVGSVDLLALLPAEEDDPGREQLTAEPPVDSEPAIEPAELHAAMADGEPSPERAMMASAEPAELRVAMVASARVPENGNVLAESDATSSQPMVTAEPANTKPAIEVIDATNSESAEQLAAAKVAEPETMDPDQPGGRFGLAMVASVSLGVATFAALTIVAVLSQDTATPEQQTVISAPTQPRSQARPVLTTPAEPSAEHTEPVASSEPEPVPAPIGESETAPQPRQRHADRQRDQVVASDQSDRPRDSSEQPSEPEPLPAPAMDAAPVATEVVLSVPMGTTVEVQPKGAVPYTVSVRRCRPLRGKSRSRKVVKTAVPRLPGRSRIHWHDANGIASVDIAE